MALRTTLSRLAKEAQQRTDPTIVIDRWRAAVSDLYNKLVLRNLRNLIQSNLLTAKEVSIERFEETLGTYEIPELHLIAGPEAVILTPISTLKIGGHGRVDMYRRGYASRRYILIWRGKVTNAAGWRIYPQNRPNEEKPYSKQLLETILDDLFAQ